MNSRFFNFARVTEECKLDNGCLFFTLRIELEMENVCLNSIFYIFHFYWKMKIAVGIWIQ